jgi:hypothetical protein
MFTQLQLGFRAAALACALLGAGCSSDAEDGWAEATDALSTRPWAASLCERPLFDSQGTHAVLQSCNGNVDVVNTATGMSTRFLANIVLPHQAQRQRKQIRGSRLAVGYRAANGAPKVAIGALGGAPTRIIDGRFAGFATDDAFVYVGPPRSGTSLRPVRRIDLVSGVDTEISETSSEFDDTYPLASGEVANTSGMNSIGWISVMKGSQLVHRIIVPNVYRNTSLEVWPNTFDGHTAIVSKRTVGAAPVAIVDFDAGAWLALPGGRWTATATHVVYFPPDGEGIYRVARMAGAVPEKLATLPTKVACKANRNQSAIRVGSNGQWALTCADQLVRLDGTTNALTITSDESTVWTSANSDFLSITPRVLPSASPELLVDLRTGQVTNIGPALDFNKKPDVVNAAASHRFATFSCPYPQKGFSYRVVNLATGAVKQQTPCDVPIFGTGAFVTDEHHATQGAPGIHFMLQSTDRTFAVRYVAP